MGIKVNGKSFRIVAGSIEKGSLMLRGPRGVYVDMVQNINDSGWRLNSWAGSQLRSVVVKAFELVVLN